MVDCRLEDWPSWWDWPSWCRAATGGVFGGARPLLLYQAVQPGDIAGKCLLLPVSQDPHVAVVAPGPGSGRQLSQPLAENGPALLEQAEPPFGRKIASESEPQVERPLVFVAALDTSQQLLEHLGPSGRDAVDLPPAARPPLRQSGTGVSGRFPAFGFHHVDGAGSLQPGEGRIERAERNRAGQAENVRQPLLQLVAVHVLLLQQAEHSHFEHAHTIACRCIEPLHRTAIRRTSYTPLFNEPSDSGEVRPLQVTWGPVVALWQ